MLLVATTREPGGGHPSKMIIVIHILVRYGAAELVGHDDEDPVETQARLLKAVAAEAGLSTQSEIPQRVRGNAKEFFADLRKRSEGLRKTTDAELEDATSFILALDQLLVAWTDTLTIMSKRFAFFGPGNTCVSLTYTQHYCVYCVYVSAQQASSFAHDFHSSSI